ncbi:hypothetical protein MAA8898_02383 [Maliponia aquimaris]|uniref:Uncharacterized protein n=1 Tax=Maliponia aquimaris TaxID=1673631 RepID=A0A238KEB3_9RHOB|nr:hypothetical protein MAA8898_02383 [Maliponia aquimaris]
MAHVGAVLTPVGWDLAAEVMAEVSKRVLKTCGDHA